MVIDSQKTGLYFFSIYAAVFNLIPKVINDQGVVGWKNPGAPNRFLLGFGFGTLRTGLDRFKNSTVPVWSGTELFRTGLGLNQNFNRTVRTKRTEVPPNQSKNRTDRKTDQKNQNFLAV